jgi:hypothetical protein
MSIDGVGRQTFASIDNAVGAGEARAGSARFDNLVSINLLDLIGAFLSTIGSSTAEWFFTGLAGKLPPGITPRDMQMASAAIQNFKSVLGDKRDLANPDVIYPENRADFILYAAQVGRDMVDGKLNRHDAALAISLILPSLGKPDPWM